MTQKGICVGEESTKLTDIKIPNGRIVAPPVDIRDDIMLARLIQSRKKPLKLFGLTQLICSFIELDEA